MRSGTMGAGRTAERVGSGSNRRVSSISFTGANGGGGLLVAKIAAAAVPSTTIAAAARGAA